MTHKACGGSCASDQLRAGLEARLAANKEWAAQKGAAYFENLQGIHTIEVLWIGCSDARVPANELIGLKPGEVFVARNVGNLATHKDMNIMACIEYAVQVLKVKHIVLCGHYGCDAVQSALTMPCKTEGLVSLWVQDIRDTRDRNVEALRQLPPGRAQADRLVEMNVLRQVCNVCTAPVVQQAWDAGQPLAVHGLVYTVSNGLLKCLYTTEGAATQPGSFLKSNSFCGSPASVAAVPGSWASSSGSSPPSVTADDDVQASEEGSVRDGSIKEAQKSMARLSLAEGRLSYEL